MPDSIGICQKRSETIKSETHRPRPGTFRENSGNPPGTYRENSGNPPGTSWENSGPPPGTSRETSGTLPERLRRQPRRHSLPTGIKTHVKPGRDGLATPSCNMDPLVGRTSRHDEAKQQQQQHVNSRGQRVREERTADALATSCFFRDGQNQEVSETTKFDRILSNLVAFGRIRPIFNPPPSIHPH